MRSIPKPNPSLAWWLLPVLLAAVACGSTAGPAPQPAVADSQMAFGVQMAQQGLWSEALFRFQQAVRANPDDYRVMNNLAVAYEATGRFDEALDSYQQALSIAPDNRELRRNYARFVEFYQSFRPQPVQAQDPNQGQQQGTASGGGGGSPAAD